MKRFFAAFIILSFSLEFLRAETVKEIKSDIKHVTVYPDRAQIIREASVPVTTGRSIISLTGLSPYIDPQSIQVRGLGDFTILSVTHRNNYLQNLEETAEVKNIRNQIESLQLKTEDEKAAISVLGEKMAFLEANRGIMIKESTFSIDQFKNMMNLYTNSIEQVSSTRLYKERLIKDYEKQIAALQKQISDKAGKQLPSGEIAVALSSDKQLTARFTFSYVVSNSGWYPSYDIRVEDIRKPVSIIYKANVFQNSGVDWKNVKISFSNATPMISGNIPELNPWFIDFYTPPVIYRPSAPAPKKSKASELMETSVQENAAIGREAASIPVLKQTGATTVTFDVAVPASAASDGKIQTLEIQKLTSPASYRYVTTPKLAPHAYLTANLSDWENLSLQNGEATLYFENTFVGKSNVNINRMEDTLALSLGTDNSIVVSREKRNEFTSSRIIGSNKTETWSFLISVRNNKPVPIEITVNDQIPLSTNSGISVEPVELSSGKLDAKTGEIKWNLKIGKGETSQVVLTYSVKYPKDKKVILE